MSESHDTLELQVSDNLLVAFENQIPNLKGLEDTSDVTILDLKEFSQGRIKVLAGDETVKVDI